MHVGLNSSRPESFFRSLSPDLTPGYAWSVTDASGRRLHGGWGGSAVLDPEVLPMSEDTLFDVASLTKPLVTALLVLQAMDRGELDLDAPVPGAPAPSFTPLQLLRHEAGFPAWHPLYAKASSREGLLRWLLLECPREEPGRRTEYSCLGYVLLGLLLEDLLHKDLHGLFAERIAGPLSLSPGEACFHPPAAFRRRVAATERTQFKEATMARQYGADIPAFKDPAGWGEANDGNSRHLGGVAGNAGLFASLGAVERLAAAFRPIRAFLLEDALTLAWRPSQGHRTAGWKAEGHPQWLAGKELPAGAIGHEGFTGTGVWMEPEAGRTYILLTNRIHPRHPGTDFGEARSAFLRMARELP